MSEGVVQVLAQTRPWVKFMSVLTFVLLGLLILVAIGVGFIGPAGPGPFGSFGTFLPMILMLGLYVPPALFLWRYAAGIGHVQAGGGVPALETALRQQKSFWKYVGIFVIVMLAVYALFIGFAVMTGFFKGRAGG